MISTASPKGRMSGVPCAKTDVAILIVAGALVFLAWRNGLLHREVRCLRAEVGAGLLELEEDLFAELQSLSQKIAKLRREMLAIARDGRPASSPVDPALSQYEEEPAEPGQAHVGSLPSRPSLGASVASCSSLGSFGSLLPLLLLGGEMPAAFEASTAQIESDDDEKLDDDGSMNRVD